MRTVFYLLHVLVLVGVSAFALHQTGRFDLAFGAYRVQGESGLLLLLVLLGVMLLLFAQRVLLWFSDIPKTWRRYRRDIRLKKGHQALIRSLSALAGGDAKLAHYQAHRAQRLLPDFAALPGVLVAATAQQQGLHDDAQKALQGLLATDARDLGVRGLVQGALAKGERDQALAFARQALAQSPKTPALQRLVYDLECEQGDFTAALARHRAMLRSRAITRDQARRDFVVVSTALHRYAAAWKADPSFIPAALAYADMLIDNRRGAFAARVIEKTFALSPHPDLCARWARLAPFGDTPKDMTRRLKWFERLLAKNPDTVPAQMMMAKACGDDRLWGKMEEYLAAAETLSPSVAVLRARADCAAAQGDTAGAQHFLTRAMDALPDPVWHCRLTGRVYDTWEPIALPHRAFGTIVWGVPGRVADLPLLHRGPLSGGGVI